MKKMKNSMLEEILDLPKCAYDSTRSCEESCVARTTREQGCAGYHPFCARGKFFLEMK